MKISPKKPLVFRGQSDKPSHVFAHLSVVEAIQSRGAYEQNGVRVESSKVYFAGGKSELVLENAELLSMRCFGHAKPYMPASGEKYGYYFNEAQILYVKSLEEELKRGLAAPTDKLMAIVTRSGSEFRVRTPILKAVRHLLATDADFSLPMNRKLSRPRKRRKAETKTTMPDIEELKD